MKTLLWICAILMVICTAMALYLTVSLGSFLLGPTITAVVAYVAYGFVIGAAKYEES